MNKERFFTNPNNGKIYPIIEAISNTFFLVFRTDMRKAVIGDSCHCIIALGLKKMDRDIVDAFVTSGKFVYLCYEPRGVAPYCYCVRYQTTAEAARVRDNFDQDKDMKTQRLYLRKPSPGRTLAGRAAANKRRRQEIKDGAPVKARGNQVRNSRLMRIGIAHRPKVHIVRNTVHIGEPQVAA